MEGNILSGIIVLIVTVLLWLIIYLMSYDSKDDFLFEKICASIMSGFLLIIGISLLTSTPNDKVLEYLRGNIEVIYEKVYVDSNLVRIDTIIKPKK